MSAHNPPFLKRFREKMGGNLSLEDARAIQRAFVAALREEVEFRFNETQPADPLAFTPLVIAGLGSFKMKTRPERKFAGVGGPVVKPPARRLVFTAKWEEIK